MAQIVSTISCYALLMFFGASSYAENFLTIKQSQIKFGTQPFNPENFKSGSSRIRAEMAADLVASKALIGKPLNSISSILGKPDGYFENKAIPAYLISPKTSRKEVWQIVVLPDSKWERVSEVKIHKNCCD